MRLEIRIFTTDTRVTRAKLSLRHTLPFAGPVGSQETKSQLEP